MIQRLQTGLTDESQACRPVPRLFKPDEAIYLVSMQDSAAHPTATQAALPACQDWDAQPPRGVWGWASSPGGPNEP